jgi:hypothetical protein
MCECNVCKSAQKYRGKYADRSEVFCGENSQAIDMYFKEKKLRSMPGFIGFTNRKTGMLDRKKRPAWCPKYECLVKTPNTDFNLEKKYKDIKTEE